MVYRSPSVSIQQLVQHMTTLLEYVNNVNIATVIVGDFNDDVMCKRGSQVEYANYVIPWVYTAGHATHH